MDRRATHCRVDEYMEYAQEYAQCIRDLMSPYRLLMSADASRQLQEHVSNCEKSTQIRSVPSTTP
jgi:hypothetical protein